MFPVPPKITGRAFAKDRFEKLPFAAEIFPPKFPPDKKLNEPAEGLEKVDVANVPVTLADPVTSRAKDGLVLLTPK